MQINISLALSTVHTEGRFAGNKGTPVPLPQGGHPAPVRIRILPPSSAPILLHPAQVHWQRLPHLQPPPRRRCREQPIVKRCLLHLSTYHPTATRLPSPAYHPTTTTFRLSPQPLQPATAIFVVIITVIRPLSSSGTTSPQTPCLSSLLQLLAPNPLTHHTTWHLPACQTPARCQQGWVIEYSYMWYSAQ